MATVGIHHDKGIAVRPNPSATETRHLSPGMPMHRCLKIKKIDLLKSGHPACGSWTTRSNFIEFDFRAYKTRTRWISDRL